MHDRTHRRSGRGNRPDQPTPTTAFHLAAPAPRPAFAMLDDAALARLRSRALDLLESHGVVVTHPQAHAALGRAGARDGADPNRLRLPRPLVEEALAAAPKSVTLCAKSPDKDLVLPRADRGFVMRTGTGAHGFVDPVTARYRNLMLDDVKWIAAVGNHLDQVGFLAHPFVHGVPEVTADIHGFAALVAATDKHVWIQPYETENVGFLMRLAALAAGGEAALRARPIASCIVCAFTPFEFKHMDIEAMILCGKYGLPIHACSLPSAGGTAPLTAAGSALMAVAEIIALVTMAHILAPGTAVIATPLMFTLDMRTGRSLQSCVESLQAVAIAVQTLKRCFGLLTHTYGAGSDTPDVDAQSLAERALLGQTVALAGADILGGVGQLECATVFSPVQAVIDNELGAMLRHFVAAPAIDDESLNWPEISTMRAGGHFLDSPHTLKHCRQQFMPEIFRRDGRDGYEASGRRTAIDQAREICLDMANRSAPPNLPDEVTRRAIAETVAAGDRAILGTAAKPAAAD